MEGYTFTKKRKRYSVMADIVLLHYQGTDDRACIGYVVLSASNCPVEGTAYETLEELRDSYKWMLDGTQT
jgi:hypothetical protein